MLSGNDFIILNNKEAKFFYYILALAEVKRLKESDLHLRLELINNLKRFLEYV